MGLLRKSELLTLKWSDIDFERGFIYLTQTKNGERREVFRSTSLSDSDEPRSLIPMNFAHLFR